MTSLSDSLSLIHRKPQFHDEFVTKRKKPVTGSSDHGKDLQVNQVLESKSRAELQLPRSAESCR